MVYNPDIPPTTDGIKLTDAEWEEYQRQRDEFWEACFSSRVNAP